MSDNEYPVRNEVTNDHGFLQIVDEDGTPVCSQCGAMVDSNRGQGTVCATCAHEILVECELDYDEGPFASDVIDPEFERDFATACNMMLGLPYEEAVKEGTQWVKEARGEQNGV